MVELVTTTSVRELSFSIHTFGEDAISASALVTARGS